jgi:hypothetical protein
VPGDHCKAGTKRSVYPVTDRIMELDIEVETSLPAHYERNLGPIAQGWSDKKSVHGIQIISFVSQPEAGVTTFATLGLSRFVLKLPGDRDIRQELLVSANDCFSHFEVASFLLCVAESLLDGKKGLLLGEVIGPGNPVIPGASARAVYVANPSPFNDSLTQFTSAPPLVFAYLIPITVDEAFLVRDHGWRWFENELAEQNQNVWDLGRSEEVLCKG